MDISVRHVHRVFSNQDLTVAGWIRAERLQRCQNDLRDPRLQSKSITEIAFFWGFNDSAHFSRAFKKQYRVCPRAFRAHVQAGLAIPVDGTTQPNTMRAPWVRQLRPAEYHNLKILRTV
jgi:AraC-like DNA-binding protein